MRIATIIAALALAIANPAPAGACVVCCMPAAHYFEASPADLDPNELVLEVRRERAEKITPPRDDYDGATWIHHFSVVRVVHGKFDGDAVSILFSSGPCQSYFAPPANGAETGLLVGFVVPASPEWDGAVGMALRYPGSPPRRERFDFNLVARVMQDDPAAMMEALLKLRDPAAKKVLYDRATAILRARADAGDPSAMMQLGLALRQGYQTDFKAMMDRMTGPYIDPAKEWIERAAALGDTKAMYMMAQSLDRHPTRAEATHWYIMSAEAGHACAMGRLALRYRFGLGETEDRKQAMHWYSRATAAGAVLSPYGFEIEGDPPPGWTGGSALQCP